MVELQKLFRSQSSWKGGSGGGHRTSFQEEAWKRYNRRMQEEYEEELERVVSFKILLSLCCFSIVDDKIEIFHLSWI